MTKEWTAHPMGYLGTSFVLACDSEDEALALRDAVSDATGKRVTCAGHVLGIDTYCIADASHVHGSLCAMGYRVSHIDPMPDPEYADPTDEDYRRDEM